MEKGLKMQKSSIVIVLTVAAILVFGLGAVVYRSNVGIKPSLEESVAGNTLIRPHSPVIGKDNAPVTIVEFFDPSCESCRAFYPVVKEVLGRYPDDVRVVLRYAAFHEGSDEAVAIIEAARLQNVFLPVLEALLDKQPEWAIHGAPDLSRAWEVAALAGLNVEKAKQDIAARNIPSLLQQETEDIKGNNVRGTPSFFINGKRLSSLGRQQLIDAVDGEVAIAKGQ